MHSRAHLLIQKQFYMLKKEGPWGIHAEQMFDTNMFEWIVKMKPFKGSSWEGGEFTVYLRFNEYFHDKPPEVYFYTIPFHPNIDPVSGRPCVDFLDDPQKWSSDYSISYILLSLQLLLDEPVLQNPVNVEAMTLVLTQPDKYSSIIHHCVTASLHTPALSMSSKSNSMSSASQRTSHKPASLQPTAKPLSAKTVRKLSFEDYYATWRQIATSKPISSIADINEEDMETGQSLYNVQASQVTQSTKQDPSLQAELLEKELKYGRFDNKPVVKEAKETHLNRIQRMKKLYLQPRNTPRKVTSAGSFFHEDLAVAGAETGKHDEQEEEMFEEEENELVAWTASLDEDAI
ncbi:Ubiquitin-conjugating enzyme E2 U [Lamellibrachia satsuma]|nr:Ubiquitin-conjugating enzyme E2 U [Lamellibrachia satsuma]